MPRGRPSKNSKDVVIKTAELFGWALGGLEREIAQTRERLSGLTAHANKLRAQIGAKAGSSAAVPSDEAAPGRKRRRRKMSPESRKRISEMMKKRWAERKRGK